MEWKRNATEHLIREYKKHPVLYDMRHPRYYNKTVRGQALSEIVDEMQNVRRDTNMKEVLRKIQTIRTQFGQELAKARRHSASGATYQPTAWWFQGLSFLQNHIKHRSIDFNPADSDTSWKQDPDDNSTFNVSIVRNGSSASPNDLSNADFEHSTDGMEFETEVHYEINPIDMKSIKTVELKPIQSAGTGVRRGETWHSERLERKRNAQEAFSGDKPSSSPSFQEQPSEQATLVEINPVEPVSATSIPRNVIVMDERQRSLGNFVASQMSGIKDDYLYYETQMEVLNVINRGILRQLKMDKSPKTPDESSEWERGKTQAKG